MTPDGPAQGGLRWGRLVAASVALLVAAGVALLAWWGATRETQVASFAVRGAATGVALDLRGGSAEIVGGGDRDDIQVRRTDRFAFGHRAVTRRGVSGGVVQIVTRCPRTVMGSCSARYRIVVPDNVPVTVRTTEGDVRFDRFRGSAQVTTSGGDIDIGGFCGFSLQASTDAGDVTAGAVCPPERLLLRSSSGDVRASVPQGRYRVDADSDSGSRDVRGVSAETDAPFQIQALSDSGDVTVEGRR